MILSLLDSKGISYRKVATTNGGEYASACPGCGGDDRFRIWPAADNGSGRYWCRGCGKSGDAIQFRRDFMGQSFKEAALAEGKQLDATYHVPKPEQKSGTGRGRPATKEYQGNNSDTWREHASAFVEWAHRLLSCDEAAKVLADRGITMETATKWQLGWNPGENGRDIFRPRSSWGLEEVRKKDGKPKRLWLPRGLVIPWFRDGIRRIRIRRPRNHLRNDHDPRYYLVPGSSAEPFVADNGKSAWVIVESELDAILISQEAGDLVSVVALGSAANLPTGQLSSRLMDADIILVSLDYDQAGIRASDKWDAYPNAKDWPVPVGKDPTDMHRAGISVRQWILSGLPPAWHIVPHSRLRTENDSGGVNIPCTSGGSCRAEAQASPPEPEQPQTLTPQPLRHWRDSARVVRLSEFLKANSSAGIRLLEADGCMVLRFEPGLTPDQKERWQIALQAENLLFKALNDLTTLAKKGLLRLPKG